MDPSEWISLANTAGSIVMAVLFLRHLRDERVSREAVDTARQEALTHIGDDCHEHSLKLTETMAKALDSANDVISENTRILGQITILIQNLNFRRTEKP